MLQLLGYAAPNKKNHTRLRPNPGLLSLGKFPDSMKFNKLIGKQNFSQNLLKFLNFFNGQLFHFKEKYQEIL